MTQAIADRIEPAAPTIANARPGVADSRFLTAIVVGLSALFIYPQVFILPGTPIVANGDQAIYLHHAARMVDGEMIYRDYDHFTLPGTDVFYATLFRIFSVRAWIPQATLVALGAAMVWLIVLVSGKLMSGAAVYLPALLFVTLPFSSYLDATHHYFSLVAVTGALAIVLEARSGARLFWAGVLIGIATFFTQSMALVGAGFAVFLLRERDRGKQAWIALAKKEASLGAGFVVTLTACMAYFVREVGLKKIVNFTVVFVVKYYPADWYNNWRVYLAGRPRLFHEWTEWFDLPAFALIHLIVPLIYILFVVYAFKRAAISGELRRRLVLINLTGLVMFLTVASAPAYSRLYVVSPPALVLLVWLLARFSKVPFSKVPSSKVSRMVLRFAWVGVFTMLLARPVVAQVRWKAFLDLPTGRTAFFKPILYDKCQWMAERARPFDYFFGDHLIAFALRLRNAGRVPYLSPTEYTRPEEVADAIHGIEMHRVRFVSWYRGLDHSRDLARHPEGDHLAPLRAYLQANYHVAEIFFNGDKIWERNQQKEKEVLPPGAIEPAPTAGNQ